MNKTKVNQDFYNSAYKSRSAVLGLLHTWVSYDQQSKSRRNFTQLYSALAAPAAGGLPLKVLDYGFGHGALLLKLPRQCQAFGCDLAEEAVHKFSRIASLLRRDIAVGPPAMLPAYSGAGRFDVISCSHVLEHVPDDEALLKLFAANLRPEGTLLINLPINEVWRDPNHVRDYDAAGTRLLLERCGFRVEKIVEADRLTAFFLHHEQVERKGPVLRVVLRALRFLFAVAPQAVAEAAEKVLSARHRNQQLIVLARATPRDEALRG